MTLATKTGNGQSPNTNSLGLEKNDYRGNPSTLCPGCGHDSIANQIITSAYELSLDAHRVVKLSGIGCSSKSPAYFMNRSHGFNTLHGRMPSVATGVAMANHTLLSIGVSGDGDTGSIGLGQYKHMLRRNVPIVYIIENNGVYGLTKGQFSATADVGQKLKYAGLNELPPVDLCIEAIVNDCGFVARSFAGDAKQVRELLKAAMAYKGTAVLDIISPCVTFNNHDESTKSYAWGREHEEPLHDISLVPFYEEIQIDYEPGTVTEVKLHDGPVIQLKKLDRDYDPTDRMAALTLLENVRGQNIFPTGLLYISQSRETLPDLMHLTETPLAHLSVEKLRPSPEALDEIMGEFA